MTHLTRDDLIAWRDTPSESSRARVIEHLAVCDACAGAYAELLRRAPVEDAPHFDPRDFVERGYAAMPRRARVLTFRRAWWIPLAAAAGLALFVWVPARNARPDVVPTGAIRGARLEAVAPRGEVGGPLEFRWSDSSSPDRYAVEVTDGAGKRVLYREVRDARLPADPAIDALIRPGVSYTWTVAALDAAGEVISRSQPAPFVRAAAK